MEAEAKKRPSNGKQQSLLWGGGWDGEGEESWIEVGGRGGDAVLPTLHSLYSTSIKPECHLLISRLPWHGLPWQLASLPPHVTLFWEWAQRIGFPASKPSATSHFYSSAVTFWPFLLI